MACPAIREESGVGRGSRPGRIILLNGASSSGKSSIGRALLPLLSEPWFLVAVDSIGAMRSVGQTQHLSSAELDDVLRRTRLGYHRVVAALASVGNDVIMDYPLSESWRVADLLQVLEPYDVTLVEIRCASDELERRERQRADRPAGLAASQDQVYAWGHADIVVDTTASTPEESARAIADVFLAGAAPTAFERLTRASAP